MKKLMGLYCVAMAGMILGCASSGQKTESTETAADAAAKTEQTAESAASDAPKMAQIAPECRKKIVKMVTKQEGGQQYLLDDGTLWQVMPDASVKLVKKLPDGVDNYALIPSTDVIIHYYPDKIMLEHVETGTEFFKLKGEPSLKGVMFTPDNNEMGILDKDSTINIWNVPDKFSGINIAERVQDFMNRQSPDYKLRFSTNPYLISLAGHGKAVMASDDQENNKIGLIYLMDEENNKGVLKAIARTNVHIAHLAISLSGRTVAATDVNQQLYVSSTGEDKGFKVYGTGYKDAKNVKFVGENVLVIGADKLTLVDVANGMQLWTHDVKAISCYAPSKDKVLCNTGDTIEEINGNDGKLVRTLFFNDKNWGELKKDNALGGTAEASCLTYK